MTEKEYGKYLKSSGFQACLPGVDMCDGRDTAPRREDYWASTFNRSPLATNKGLQVATVWQKQC